VTLSVTHNYIVGQKVTFKIPTVTAAAFGMTQLNGITATIIRTNDADADGLFNTITVDVDTTGYTAFALPLTAALHLAMQWLFLLVKILPRLLMLV